MARVPRLIIHDGDPANVAVENWLPSDMLSHALGPQPHAPVQHGAHGL
jgi:hypothetical protein